MGWPIGWSSLEPLAAIDLRPIGEESADIPRVKANVKHRGHRLQALGNGQVPQCAAVVLASEKT